MTSRRLWVFGTGTGVGKTYASRRILEALVAQGWRARGIKPIESGILAAEFGRHGTTDAERLGQVSGEVTQPLYALRDPVSPHLAARAEGRSLEASAVARWIDDLDVGLFDPLVIETAGGVFSPLGPRLSNFQLALDCARPGDGWLLLAADALGVLHDLSACLLGMSSLGRLPDAVLFCESRERDASTGTNAVEFRDVVLPQLGLDREPVLLGTLAAGARDCESFVSWWGTSRVSPR